MLHLRPLPNAHKSQLASLQSHVLEDLQRDKNRKTAANDDLKEPGDKRPWHQWEDR